MVRMSSLQNKAVYSDLNDLNKGESERETEDLTTCPFKQITDTYLGKATLNRSKGSRQNRLFYSMSPVGHRFLENIDSHDPQFSAIQYLAKQLNKTLEENSAHGFEDRLSRYWQQHPPTYPVCSLRDTALGAVLNEVWFAFFARPCPHSELITGAARDVLMVVKDWDVVDLALRQQAIALIADAVQQGLNPQLQLDSLFHRMHEVIFALTVSAVDELSEGFAHVLLCLVQSDDPLPSTKREFVMATYEALRLYPLFTRSTRPARQGQGLYLLNYVRYHRRTDLFGDDAKQFKWQRWQHNKTLLGKTLVFGVSGNRSCPGRGSAIKLVPAMVSVWLRTYQTRSGIVHCRQLPCGGLAIAAPLGRKTCPLAYWRHLGVWAYRRLTFWLGMKWWVKYRNSFAAHRLAEADRYYETLAFETAAPALSTRPLPAALSEVSSIR